MKKIISTLKKMFADPRLFYYYAQRVIRPTFLRDFFANIVAFFQPGALIKPDKLAKEKVAQLERDGFVFLENLVSPQQIREMTQYLENQEGVEIRREDRARHKMRDGLPADCRKLYYEKEVVLNCPYVLNIANHPKVLEIVSSALKCRPTISAILAWWSMPGTEQDQDELYQEDMYHRDVDDFSFFKLFVYLTDVTDENGPHLFIKGSHKSNSFVRRGPISDADVEQVFGKESYVNYTGPAGTVFIENTWGIHRATPLKSGKRLIFQVLYSLTSTNPVAPEKPLELPLPPGLDSYTNRVYVKS